MIGLPLDDAQDDRVPGPHGHAVDQQLAQLLDRSGGVVLRACRRAGVHQDHVMLCQRPREPRSQRLVRSSA